MDGKLYDFLERHLAQHGIRMHDNCNVHFSTVIDLKFCEFVAYANRFSVKSITKEINDWKDGNEIYYRLPTPEELKMLSIIETYVRKYKINKLLNQI